MSEWRLYPAILSHWERQGYHVASQLTDPRGARFEVDVVAFTPHLDDVRITEVKLEPSPSFRAQCLARLRLAPRVYAALPAHHADRMMDLLDHDDADPLGLLAVHADHVEETKPATPTHEHRQEGKARVLERALRSTLA